MLLRLEPGLPLYQQIAAAVRRAVRDGDVGEGDRLPAARDLAKTLGVNMHTVLRAYRDLQDEGLLDLRRGRGAVVRGGSRGPAALGDLVAGLAREARRLGVTRDEVAGMIDKEMQ